MKTLTAVVIALWLAGCATAPAPLPGAQTYSGEVRNWNAKNNTVTLYQPNAGLVHLKVTPDQLNGLELNRTARVQGVPTEPADLLVLVPAGPVTAVPKAPAEILELNGTVTSVSPTGRLAASTTTIRDGPSHRGLGAPQGARPEHGTGSIRRLLPRK